MGAAELAPLGAKGAGLAVEAGEVRPLKPAGAPPAAGLGSAGKPLPGQDVELSAASLGAVRSKQGIVAGGGSPLAPAG